MKRWYRVYRESYCEVHADNITDAIHEARKLPKECWQDNNSNILKVHPDDDLNEDEKELRLGKALAQLIREGGEVKIVEKDPE